jgi:Lrp/AsnC family leucine-responsive transcriptional regulator
MDSVDREVLLALQADGRQSNLTLARSLGLSASAMSGRVRRLEQTGAIRGYRAIVDPAALGITVRAFVVARLREHSERSILEFEQGVQKVSGVRACCHVTGQFDMVLELAVRNLEHLAQMIRVDLAKIPGVTQLETMLVLAESVSDPGWPNVLETHSQRQDASSRRGRRMPNISSS